MNPHPNNSHVQGARRRFPSIHPVLCLALLALSACADTAWQRYAFEGVRYTAGQCQIARKPTDPACPAIPEYSQYAVERARARGTSDSDSTAQPQPPKP